MVETFRRRILAASREQPLRIRGGGSKDFYGNPPRGEVLDTRDHAGIVSYEPTELVITAKAGTPLADIEAVLAEGGQFLAFEPPAFGAPATAGGLVAAGLSGPRRAAVGAVRDFVLGIRLMDGEGRELTFGGQVMKNVAGYDVSRLMAGSLGTLGLILEASIKVLPRPAAEATLRFELPQARALESLNAWAGQPLPVSASAWQDGVLSLRLSGARAAVAAAQERLGGERVADAAAAAFWMDLREQRLQFFGSDEPLWRLSVPSVAGPMDLPGGQLIEWGGAQRWWRGSLAPARLQELAGRAGGHATLFRGGDRRVGIFQPLPPVLLQLHRQLKTAFDPRGVFDGGRLYTNL